MSPNQKAIWFEHKMYPTIPIHVIGGNVVIRGKVDPQLFNLAINHVVNQSDSLRIKVHEIDGQPYQEFVPKLDYNTEFVDCSNEENPEQAAKKWLQDAFGKPFDIENDVLFQFALVRASDDLSFWLVKWHHLVNDGWGIAMNIKRVGEAYTHFAQGSEPDETSFSYETCVLDEIKYLGSANAQKDRDYWVKKFTPIPEQLLLPHHKNQYPQDVIPSERESFWLKSAFYAELNQLAKSQKVSIFHVFIGLLYTWFSRVNDKKDMVIGLPILNRTNKKAKQTLGLFIGISPLRIQVSEEISFADLLTYIRNSLREGYRYQRLPINEINIAIDKSGQNITQQLFDIELSYEKHDYNTSFDGAKSKSAAFTNKIEQTPLVVFIREFHQGEDVRVDFDYNFAYFTAEEICGISQNVKILLERIVENPNKKLMDYDILTNEDRNKILFEFNSTDTEYSINETICQLIEKQVVNSPDSVAFQIENRKYTYKEFWNKVNSLAYYLVENNVKEGQFIPIVAYKNIELPISIIAVLRTGAAFVPIDPSLPKKRKHEIFNDTNSHIILTTNNLKTRQLPNIEQKIVIVSEVANYSGTTNDNSNINSAIYAIYTSGSTGKPKGTINLHKGISNRFLFMNQKFGSNNKETVLLTTNPAFDSAVWQLFWPLINGAKCVITDEMRFNAAGTVSVIFEHNVSFIDFSPSVFGVIVDYLSENPESRIKLKSLRQIILGGEAIIPSHVKLFRSWFPAINIANAYGPTETSIGTVFYDIESQIPQVIPIGKPISNVYTLILDKQQKPVPLGVSGELNIGGMCVGSGYLQNQELTKKLFRNPEISGFDKGIFYRTGDLASYASDGNILFHGRIDSQLKIRGFRVEPDEVTSILRSHSDVKNAIVVAHKPKTNLTQLIAYYSANKELLPTILEKFLAEVLPAYMIPAGFVFVKEIPISKSGKVDVSKLPAIKDIVGINPLNEYVEPTTEMEKNLAKIWSEILAVPKIGIHDDFFKLGGHSLIATRIVSRLLRFHSIEIKLRDIFNTPTISCLSKKAKIVTRKTTDYIPTLQKADYYPVSHAQRRLWVLYNFDLVQTAYNMSACFLLKGDLNYIALEKSFNAIIRRHEILRTYFKSNNGELFQVVSDEANLQIKNVDLQVSVSQTSENAAIDEYFESEEIAFNLEDAPLFRVSLLKLTDNSKALVFNMHHIISDGWSLDVFVKELSVFYRKFIQDEQLSLADFEIKNPPLRIHYKDFSVWQNKFLQNTALVKSARKFWLNMFADDIPVLNLPTDFSRPVEQSYKGKYFSFSLTDKQTFDIQQFARKTKTSLYMNLLAMIKTLLYRYSGQKQLVIGCPVAGRNHDELENQMGLYINTLAIKSEINPDASFEDFLETIRELTTQSFEYQTYPFDKLVDELDIERDTSRNPLFDVMVVLQNTPPTALELEGIDIQRIRTGQDVSTFDLTFYFTKIEGQIKVDIEYSCDLFLQTRIELMSQHFSHLVDDVLKNPKQKISNINILAEEEKQKLLQFSQGKQVDFPLENSLVDLFIEQVEKTPERIAIVSGAKELTYKELYEFSSNIAFEIQNRIQINQNSRIALYLDKSELIVCGIFGVLMAGAAYVPIMPDYPAERVKFMVADSVCSAILTEDIYADELRNNSDYPIIVADKLSYEKNISFNIPTIDSSKLAYVIYTSGSTGTPKGVAVSHRSVVNLVYLLRDLIYADDEILREPLLTDFVFDSSVHEIFGAILSGNELHIIASDVQKDGFKLNDYVNNCKIDTIPAAPSLLSMLIEARKTTTKNYPVKNFLIGGDVLTPELVKEFYSMPDNTNSLLANMYGPTEATVEVSVYDCKNHTGMETVSIGKPLDNTSLYILDNELNLLPIGIQGELYIGGEGVTNGYLNMPELNSEKFIENPFAHGSKMYRTGDVAMWAADGNILLFGRLDFQLKVRGYRIEPLDIEQHIRNTGLVDDVAVVAKKSEKSDELIGFVVGCENTHDLEIELMKVLPRYMIPTQFIVIDSIPLATFGKIDRKKLSETKISNLAPKREIKAPTNEIEIELLDIWRNTLDIEEISIDDNFFEIGGHSLKATRLVSQIVLKMKTEIELRDVFTNPTIRMLALVIQAIRWTNQDFDIDDSFEEIII